MRSDTVAVISHNNSCDVRSFAWLDLVTCWTGGPRQERGPVAGCLAGARAVQRVDVVPGRRDPVCGPDELDTRCRVAIDVTTEQPTDCIVPTTTNIEHLWWW